VRFFVIRRGSSPPSKGQNAVYLTIDNWNDYSFVTSFSVFAFDEAGQGHDLHAVRIGFIGQTTNTSTHSTLESPFEFLRDGYFSLGMSVEYYKALNSNFSKEWRESYLRALKDVTFDQVLLKQVEGEEVFQTSHLRSINVRMIRDQFASVLDGEVELTDFNFGFHLPQAENFAEFDLSFSVTANSLPSTNIHALIGRNGVGKTTLLQAMVTAIASPEDTRSRFYIDGAFGRSPIGAGYFGKVVSIAFSVFDPFKLPKEREGADYSYIGLTEYADAGGLLTKSEEQIYQEFLNGLEFCIQDERRRNRWIQAVETLQSDDNFSEMGLLELAELRGSELRDFGMDRIKRMSSGHTIVLLIMTLLVAKVEEKTLVLFDEPEGHLHPPLLSALMRSLSQLLHTRNGVAIIATHSPVVLQEIPKSCVWKVFRTRRTSEKMRPVTETFGENVGILTREVFGLEIEKSGFHTILRQLVEQGMGYEQILAETGNSLGTEAKGILRAMVTNRENEKNTR
jgi:predicted ATPase